jgi:hypothetical protein
LRTKIKERYLIVSKNKAVQSQQDTTTSGLYLSFLLSKENTLHKEDRDHSDSWSSYKDPLLLSIRVRTAAGRVSCWKLEVGVIVKGAED